LNAISSSRALARSFMLQLGVLNMFRGSVLGAICAASLGVAACSATASAHVTLETREAAVGAPYKAVLRVPHGCEGTATISVRIRVPEGMIAVKPMPKPGWKIDTVTGKYPRTYNYFHGAKLSEGVTEVSFSGGNLPDAYYDEFVVTGFLAGDLEAGKTLYFPVVQECEKGVHRWIEIPAAGKSSGDLPEPAPALKLLPKR
jgi:periplasmic copper chaperone A